MKKVLLTMVTAGLVLTSCEKESNEVVTDMNDDAVVMEDNTVVDNTVSNNATEVDNTVSNGAEWAGTYEGTMPCADCEGIETKITLNEDGTYSKEQEYLGEDGENKFSESGTFVWNDDQTVVTLTDKDNAENKSMFKVEEGKITALDADGNVVEGDLADYYVLNKK